MLREKSCGIVPYREVNGTVVYLVISSAVTKREHWEFPKGGVEEGEREIDTALRELWEETGVKDVRVLPGYREPIRYIYRRPEGLVSKQVVYFIGKVGNPAVTLREREAKDYRWADYEETRKLLRHANARALLERCHAFITGRPLRPEAQPQRPQRPAPPRPAAEAPRPQQPPPQPPPQQQPQQQAQQQAQQAERRRRPPGKPPEVAASTTATIPSLPVQKPLGPPAAEAGRRRRRRRRRGGKGRGAQARPAGAPNQSDDKT